jgi:hypothetical protein
MTSPAKDDLMDASSSRAEASELPSLSPDALLRRAALVQAFNEKGFPMTTSTLATNATRGGGPPYRLFGRIPLYRWGDALAWAESLMTAPRNSSADGDVSTDELRSIRIPSSEATEAA